MGCNICPRSCGTDRISGKGRCGMGPNPVIAKAYLHRWEEPIVSGTKGSGTVFFSGCPLSCVFCQNHVISHDKFGIEISIKQLSEVFLNLQGQGAHNINLVNPTHFAPAIMESIDLVRNELNIPVIWNSSGYETVDTVRALKGYVDVYMPDVKYFSPRLSAEFSKAPDYFEKASRAVWEMYCQAGDACFDSEGIIKKGLIIRHLILPNCTHDSVKILGWIGDTFKKGVVISLMSQYTPTARSVGANALGRAVSIREYSLVKRKLLEIDPEYAFVQEPESADCSYIPSFDLEGVPGIKPL